MEETNKQKIYAIDNSLVRLKKIKSKKLQITNITSKQRYHCKSCTTVRKITSMEL